jgi:hypothetical protein
VSLAIVAFEAYVALDAFPVRAPVNVVAATDVRPARVVEVAPKAIEVEPIVTVLFVSAPFGIAVNEAPEPEKVAAVTVPVSLTVTDEF